MADALVSPAVGCAMWAVSAGMIAFCSRKIREEADDARIPLMGVMGAFVFAAQMINFTIPATGSSGHLVGGMILAILLGSHAAFLTIASVLVVQALFFADGGLLALGCNIFNLGAFPAFIAYPFIFRRIAGTTPSSSRMTAACLLSAVAALQLGTLGVVAETLASGISSLPFSAFALLMQPIHLVIGVVEGFVTAAVISFVLAARPNLAPFQQPGAPRNGTGLRNIVLGFLAAALLTGGIVSWFASENPDGLEWSIRKVTGTEEIEGNKTGMHAALTAFQEKLAFLPDYRFTKPWNPVNEGGGIAETAKTHAESAKEGSRVETSVSGVAGGLITLALMLLAGFFLKKQSGTQ